MRSKSLLSVIFVLLVASMLLVACQPATPSVEEPVAEEHAAEEPVAEEPVVE